MQLRPGAREQIEHIYADLREADAATDDLEIRNLLFAIKVRLKEEIEPLLARGLPQEPTTEMRERHRDERIAKLEQWVRAHEPLLDMVAQYFAQSQ